MANNSNPEEILRGLVRNFSVIYKRYCGHETVCDVMDVLYLGIEPNWGCDEGDCDEINDGIDAIEITGSYKEEEGIK